MPGQSLTKKVFDAILPQSLQRGLKSLQSANMVRSHALGIGHARVEVVNGQDSLAVELNISQGQGVILWVEARLMRPVAVGISTIDRCVSSHSAHDSGGAVQSHWPLPFDDLGNPPEPSRTTTNIQRSRAIQGSLAKHN